MKYHFFEERDFVSNCPHAWDIISYARMQTKKKDILFESAILSQDMKSCTATFCYFSDGYQSSEITISCIFHEATKCEFSHSIK